MNIKCNQCNGIIKIKNETEWTTCPHCDATLHAKLDAKTGKWIFPNKVVIKERQARN
jgi:Zn finger protein HypA/HybF involved in hydrogenase expression